MAVFNTLSGQDYHAVQGSSFAGSLGVSNNPASITNTPYSWDINILAVQLKTITNGYRIDNYSLLTSASQSTASMNTGDFHRYLDLNFNLNLINTRIALNRTHTLAFGVNLRGNGRVLTNRYFYADSLPSVDQFLGSNLNRTLEGHFSSSSWLEAFATYSQTLWDDDQGRLNGGITLKATRGLSGAFAHLVDFSSVPTPNGGDTSFTVNSVSGKYGYSNNYDQWQNSRPASTNIRDFITNTRGGFCFDLGLEYLVKTQEVSTVYDEDNFFDYDWKFGLSLLDVGYNQYRYGNKSSMFTSPSPQLTGAVLNQQFDSLSSLADFNDSLSGIVRGFSPLGGKFRVENPTRLVINVDRAFPADFYVNAEISLNIHPSPENSNRYFTQQINLITLTPRWETRRWGFYLPLQYTIEGRFMAGAALKAGPLLLGIHNLANLFFKNRIQNGGGYLALQLRAPRNLRARADKRLDCPN